MQKGGTLCPFVCEGPALLGQIATPEETCEMKEGKSHSHLQFFCSRPAGLEEEEALGAAAHADRWHALHHRVSEGSFGEFTHQHGGPEEHGLCRQGHEEGPREHVRSCCVSKKR